MKILIVEPGKHPRVENITHTLRTLQSLVGGYIQAIYPWDVPAALVCDEEGLLKEYPFNRMAGGEAIFGTFFICGLNEEDFTDLPDDLIERFSDELHDPQILVRTPAGIIALPVNEE